MPGSVPSRVVLVGSDEVRFARCQPYLASFGDLIEHVGPLGSGEVAKLINNLLMVVNMGMAADAVRCGQDLGVEHEVLARALSTGSGSSQGIRTLPSDGSPHSLHRPSATSGAQTRKVPTCFSAGDGEPARCMLLLYRRPSDLCC